MGEIYKRPQVIQDLIEIATYIANNDLDSSDRFLRAAEETFKQLGKMPQSGKKSYFSNNCRQNMRQLTLKGFKKYLVFYQIIPTGVEIIRVFMAHEKLKLF